jgi:hypothetical protein
MQSTLENTLARLQETLRDELSGIRLEFTTQVFLHHVELYVYVLDIGEYDRVRALCSKLSAEMELDRSEPEIWLLAKAWTGPWPGGESEQKLRERRDDFKRKHGISLNVR